MSNFRMRARTHAPTSLHRRGRRRRVVERGVGSSLRGVVLGLAVLGSTIVVPDATAADLTAVRLEHTAPPQAVAGDPVDLKVDVARPCASRTACPSLQVTARYGAPLADGSSRTVTAEVLPGDGDATVALTIPGDGVRFPGLAYQLTASTPEIGVTDATDVHSYEVPVSLVYRVGFRYLDGLPATGATVVARSASTPMWIGRTDARGDAVVALAGSDLGAGRQDTDYTQLFITAFDAVPEAPTEATEIAGNGVEIATFANLGNTLLDAVDTQVQDRVFTLQPQTREFSAPAASSSAATNPYRCQTFPNGEGSVCTEFVERIYNVNVPLADNVGGGAEMNSNYSYSDSTFTSTGVLVKVGAAWTEAEGETTSEKRTSRSAGSGNIGPNGNVTALAQFNYLRERENWCYRASCTTTQRVRPEEWNGGFVGTGSAGYHDLAAQFQPSDGADCVMNVFFEFESETSKGHHLRFGIAVEGASRGLNARTRYANDRGSSVRARHHWKTTGAARSYHALFVKYGIGTYGNEDDDKCPHTHPEETWTDSSNIDKTAYGPPSRHRVNEVHHGLFRSVNNVGADRIHIFYIHPHSGRWIDLSTCRLSSPCISGLGGVGTNPPPSPDRVKRCKVITWDFEPNPVHSHCDAYTDDKAAAGYFVSLSDPSGPPGFKCSGAEGPNPAYTDGHGVDCHSMHDELSNGPGAE